MGTLMSKVLTTTTPLFGGDENSTITKSFKSALLLEAQRSADSSSQGQNRSKTAHEASPGILRVISSEDTTGKRASNHKVTRPKSPAPASRLPTRSNKGINEIVIRHKKTVDVNENPVVTRRTLSGLRKQDDGNSDDGGNVNSDTEISFQPEAWPTMDLIQDQLSKHVEIPSTIIFARFYYPIRNCSEYVDICYSASEEAKESFFESSAKLNTLITKEGIQLGDTKEEQVKFFLKILKSCMNNLQGTVWWNGISLILNEQMKSRLKVKRFDVRQSHLLFELIDIKNLKVHHANYHVELRGQVEGKSEEKFFRMQGLVARDIPVNQTRGNLVIVRIPQFTLESITY